MIEQTIWLERFINNKFLRSRFRVLPTVQNTCKGLHGTLTKQCSRVPAFSLYQLDSVAITLQPSPEWKTTTPDDTF